MYRRINISKEKLYYLYIIKGVSIIAITEELECSFATVYNRLKKFNIHLKIRSWTKKEIEFLKENYNILSSKKIANILNRTKASIDNRKRVLNLNLPKELRRVKISKVKKRLYKEGKIELSGCAKLAYEGKLKGKNNPFYGKKHSKETKKQIVKTSKNNGCYEESSKRMKNNNPMFNQKIVKNNLGCFKEGDPDNLIKKASKKLRIKPNKPEKLLMNLFKQLNLPYKYVGNSKFWIEGFNPDFINYNGQKKIIEFFGDYWHNKLKVMKRDKRRLKTYAKYGYKTLVIWNYELKNLDNVIDKIRRFDKVHSIL